MFGWLWPLAVHKGMSRRDSTRLAQHLAAAILPGLYVAAHVRAGWVSPAPSSSRVFAAAHAAQCGPAFVAGPQSQPPSAARCLPSHKPDADKQKPPSRARALSLPAWRRRRDLGLQLSGRCPAPDIASAADGGASAAPSNHETNTCAIRLACLVRWTRG